MKRILTSIAVAGFLTLGGAQASTVNDFELSSTEGSTETHVVMADNMPSSDLLAQADENEGAASEEAGEDAPKEEKKQEINQMQTLKQKFIEGGALFMAIVLLALILGLALCIERIVYLNMATTNTDKLLEDVESALASGGVEAAKEVCRNTRGPVASIFYQGLDRADEGIEQAEKSVIAYGGVQMGLLEKGLPWIALFIALAPMLGFMGTVIGMIDAFDTIVEQKDIKVDQVAKGIKVALLTTVFGLIVAIILQIFYNYIVSKIDGLVNQMEDASISLVDMLVKHKEGK